MVYGIKRTLNDDMVFGKELISQMLHIHIEVRLYTIETMAFANLHGR